VQALKERGLIDTGPKGIEVLGITTAATLQHTADIFDDLSPSSTEVAAIELSEQCSLQPQDKSALRNELSDKFKLSSVEVNQLLSDSEKIGFVDIEKIDNSNSLYFNGNLFRRDDTKKIHAILSTLTVSDQQKVTEFNNILSRRACILTTEAESILGAVLFKKLSAVGIYDINIVSNTKEAVGYITKPSAFAKYSNSMVEDAFDLAKAFVSSLTYGMTRSTYVRGQIRMIEALLSTLISGQPVGPVSAIADDYKVLELRNVVKVYQGEKNNRKGYLMKLLKKEVGVLALEAIQKGDISERSLTILPSAAVTRFDGPEINREKKRREQLQTNPKATNDMLMILRTGGGV
jgi:hypothetical protein